MKTNYVMCTPQSGITSESKFTFDMITFWSSHDGNVHFCNWIMLRFACSEYLHFKTCTSRGWCVTIWNGIVCKMPQPELPGCTRLSWQYRIVSFQFETREPPRIHLYKNEQCNHVNLKILTLHCKYFHHVNITIYIPMKCFLFLKRLLNMKHTVQYTGTNSSNVRAF